MRPGELLNMECANVYVEDRYMLGGSKTKAGKNRIIPLHDDIIPLVKAFLENIEQLEAQLKEAPQDLPKNLVLTEPLCALDVREQIFRDIIITAFDP